MSWERLVRTRAGNVAERYRVHCVSMQREKERPAQILNGIQALESESAGGRRGKREDGVNKLYTRQPAKGLATILVRIWLCPALAGPEQETFEWDTASQGQDEGRGGGGRRRRRCARSRYFRFRIDADLIISPESSRRIFIFQAQARLEGTALAKRSSPAVAQSKYGTQPQCLGSALEAGAVNNTRKALRNTNHHDHSHPLSPYAEYPEYRFPEKVSDRHGHPPLFRCDREVFSRKRLVADAVCLSEWLEN